MKIFNLQFLFAIAMVFFFVMDEITAEPVERILIAGRRVQRSVDVDGDERILAARICPHRADRILFKRFRAPESGYK